MVRRFRFLSIYFIVFKYFIVGWIATLPVLGDIFHLRGFFVIHCMMAGVMCTTWLVLFILTIVAFAKGRIFSSNDEDVVKDSANFLADRRKEKPTAMV